MPYNMEEAYGRKQKIYPIFLVFLLILFIILAIEQFPKAHAAKPDPCHQYHERAVEAQKLYQNCRDLERQESQ